MTELKAKSGVNANWSDVGANFCPPFSDANNVNIMVASVAKSFTVPDNRYYVFFNVYPRGTTFWVNPITTATIPSGDVTNGSASTMNPTGRSVTPGQTLSVITPTGGAIIQATFYE